MIELCLTCNGLGYIQLSSAIDVDDVGKRSVEIKADAMHQEKKSRG